MLKAFCLSTVLSTALILFLVEIALGDSLPGGNNYLVVSSADIASRRAQPVSSPYPVVPNSDTDQLVCYMQTADGRILDLKSLCQQNTAQNSAQNPLQNISKNVTYTCDPICKPPQPLPASLQPGNF